MRHLRQAEAEWSGLGLDEKLATVAAAHSPSSVAALHDERAAMADAYRYADAKDEGQMSALDVAIAAARREFAEIKKDKTARAGSYSYSYASLDSVMRAIRPALAHHGLDIWHHVVLCDEHWYLGTTLKHIETGSARTSQFPLPDPGEGSQEIGKAITYGRRYNITALLDLLTEDDTDAAPATRPRTPRPTKGAGNTEQPLEWLLGALRKHFGDDDERKRRVVETIFGGLSMEQVSAMGPAEVAKHLKDPVTGWRATLDEEKG